MHAAPSISIPNLTEDWLRTPESAYEAAMQICEASRRATILLETGALAPITKVRKAARAWISAIEPRIGNFQPAESLRLAHAYDHLYRIAYSAAPLPGTIDPQVFRALRASISGDTDIDQHLLFRLITLGLNRGIKEYYNLPLRWQSQKLARWYKKYTEGTPTPDEQEIRLLLTSDLTPFTGRNQASFKNRLRALLK